MTTLPEVLVTEAGYDNKGLLHLIETDVVAVTLRRSRPAPVLPFGQTRRLEGEPLQKENYRTPLRVGLSPFCDTRPLTWSVEGEGEDRNTLPRPRLRTR